MSRAPRYSVLFALPLLLAYEGLAALLSHPGKGELRNGADVMLAIGVQCRCRARTGRRSSWRAVALLGVGLVVRDMRQTRRSSAADHLRGHARANRSRSPRCFGLVIGLTTAKLLGSLHALSVTPLNQHAVGNATDAVTRRRAVRGAVLSRAPRDGPRRRRACAVRLGTRGAGILAAVVGAFIFSAFHYIGPYGDPLELQSFTFRMLSGLAFSGLYLLAASASPRGRTRSTIRSCCCV